MDIILKEDIAGLGYKYDVVNVKNGYGRNFLIPKGLAMVASSSNLKMVEENLKQMAHKAEKIKADAEAIAEKIAKVTLTVKAKVGESGRIFGAITTLQISDALKEKGIDLDRKKISFNSEVKSVGEYTATADLHKDVKEEIKFVVEAD